MKRLGLIWIVLMIISTGVQAQSLVRYEGGAEKFVFLPGSSASDTDLFLAFKDVLPGDVLVQTIQLENTSEQTVRLYLRAEPADEESKKMLENMKMTVSCRNKEIFEAAANETAQLTDNTPLGVFKTQGSTELTVTLTVPSELDNRYMGMCGVIPWVFLAEEIIDDDTPHTGEWYETGVWIGAAILLMAVLVILLIGAQRRK